MDSAAGERGYAKDGFIDLIERCLEDDEDVLADSVGSLGEESDCVLISRVISPWTGAYL